MERPHRVTHKTVSTTVDDYGQPTESEQAGTTYWVRVRAESGGERIRSGRVEGRQLYVITGDYEDMRAVSIRDRLTWEDESVTLEVLAKRNPDGHNREIEFTCAAEIVP